MQMPLKQPRRAPTKTVYEITEGCARLRATGLTRGQIGQLTGVSVQSAGAWLLGSNRPTFEKIELIQKILGIDLRSWQYLAGRYK